jgi:hypothetical protein
MSSIVVFIEKLLVIVLLVFLTKTLHTLFVSMTTHVLGQISIGIVLLLLIGNEYPRQDGVLGDIIIVSTCDLVQPLKVLIV